MNLKLNLYMEKWKGQLYIVREWGGRETCFCECVMCIIHPKVQGFHKYANGNFRPSPSVARTSPDRTCVASEPSKVSCIYSAFFRLFPLYIDLIRFKNKKITCLKFKLVQSHSIHMDWNQTEQALRRALCSPCFQSH